GGEPEGVKAVQPDLSCPEGVACGLAGVTALFLHPGAVGLAAGGLLALARERGVQRVAALSAASADDPRCGVPGRCSAVTGGMQISSCSAEGAKAVRGVARAAGKAGLE